MKIYSKRRSEQADSISETMYNFEHDAWQKQLSVCGVDEAGRGCLAGPVVVAAAILKPDTKHPLLRDSKTLSGDELIFMYQWLQDKSISSVSIGSARIIDQYNIYQTTARHMRSALLHLLSQQTGPVKTILIDAMPLNLHNTPYGEIPVISMIKGESKSASIAAASIIAKVTRDAIMTRLETTFPGYGLAQHKGYCTKAHQNNIIQLKPAIIHRTSYLTWLTKDQENEQKSIFC